jgi:dihydroneopterin aldolase
VTAPDIGRGQAGASSSTRSGMLTAGVGETKINGLRLRCVVDDDLVRKSRSDIIVDLRIGVPATPVVATGWDYRPAAKDVVALAARDVYRSLNHLAEEIALLLVVAHCTPYAEVRVLMPDSLRYADSVGIAIFRTTSDYIKATKEAGR